MRHQQVLTRKGPRRFVSEEGLYRFKRMMRHWREMVILDVQQTFVLQRAILDWRYAVVRAFRIMTDEQITNLLSLRGSWFIREHPEPITLDGRIVIPPPVPVERPGRELVDFVRDKQNVHRKATVDQTTEIVKRVLKIPVPDEYRWNTSTLSKTPGEIIVSCKLTPVAGAAMMDKYSKDDDVYELGDGIYGKVLDSVWQYISKSDDKERLCAILRTELQDNVGMCAQGNLSRLCNTLAGYIDGMNTQESVSERLGREFPKLFEIEDETQRIAAGKNILNEVQLPTEEWDAWLDALKV